MFRCPEDAATSAVLSLLLEVSANPKSGNVDRGHDLPDMRYEDFLVSSTASFPVFLKAAKKEERIGELILECVRNSYEKTSKNIHFGCFVLLVPLVYSWEGDAKDIASNAADALKMTVKEDSLALLDAFNLSKPRVIEVKDLSLKDDEIRNFILKNNLNLYEWMKRAPEENLIAKELVEGYKISLRGMELIFEFYSGDINHATVMTYHILLSEFRDPLIISKFGEEVADEVRDRTKTYLSTGNFNELDEELIARGINPGTIADLTASSLYLAIAEGLRI